MLSEVNTRKTLSLMNLNALDRKLNRNPTRQQKTRLNSCEMSRESTEDRNTIRRQKSLQAESASETKI